MIYYIIKYYVVFRLSPLHLDNRISVSQHKTTLYEPIHPSHKAFQPGKETLVAAVCPFLAAYRLKEQLIPSRLPCLRFILRVEGRW